MRIANSQDPDVRYSLQKRKFPTGFGEEYIEWESRSCVPIMQEIIDWQCHGRTIKVSRHHANNLGMTFQMEHLDEAVKPYLGAEVQPFEVPPRSVPYDPDTHIRADYVLEHLGQFLIGMTRNVAQRKALYERHANLNMKCRLLAATRGQFPSRR